MSDNSSDPWGSRPTVPLQPQPSAPAAARSIPPAGGSPQRRPQASRRQPRRSGCGRLALVVLAVAALAVFGLGVALVGYASIARDLPMPDELQARASQFASTLIYDRDGNLLNEVGDPNRGRRTAVPLDQISPYLIDATIATEDPNFYRHPGVDPVGLLRALYYAVQERSLSGPGGSTITQQLVKLTFLSSEKTVSRKIKEAILAAEITRRYSKDTILQIYLNEIYYGNLAYGIEAAAETCFGRPARDLTLAQAAMLAGLPQAPAYYDPYAKLWEADPQAAAGSAKPGAVKRRQGEVLRLMVERGYITPGQADAAWIEPLELKPLSQVYDSRYPHFVQYARAEVEQTLGPQLAAKGGLRIYTTLDGRLQAAAEEEVRKQVAALAGQGGHNAATVAIRPSTGEVLAMVGSADFDDARISGQINMSLAPRQPGSAIKPFTYLAAFEMPAAAIPPEPDGKISAIEPPAYWAPATAIMDNRTEFPDGTNPPYVPVNYDGKEHGLVSVRAALANSYNIPAVKALEHVGLDRLKDVARRAGITTLTRPDYGLSLTLGGGEVTLLELTGAYATLANGGTHALVSPIACVLDAEGRLIWQGSAADAVAACATAAANRAAGMITPAPGQPAFDPQHVYLITSILSDADARAPMFGSAASVMSLAGRPAAVKTGTTNDYRDAWTLGYVPDLAVGAWVGNADYTPMQKVAGSLGAAPIWHNVMARALEGRPVQPFTPPAGIEQATVCVDSGTLPGEACPKRREEVFASGRGPLPATYDLWRRVQVDRVTGQLATEFTPADRIEPRDVMAFPERYREWAAAHGYPVLAAVQPQYAFAPELELFSPAGGSTVTAAVPVSGRVRIPEPLVWRLEYGVGPSPIGWGVLSGPSPADPADPAGRQVDGALGMWDVPALAALHQVNDFSLRLTAYDPANLAYPVAVSNVAYVYFQAPTPTSSPTATIEATPTPTETPTPDPTAEPTATPEPTAIPTPEPTTAPTLPVPGGVRAAIVEPLEGAQVRGAVQVMGVADGPAFASYVVEYAPGDRPQETDWLPVALPVQQPVSGGVLALWRADLLNPGVYSLRLRVFDNGGQPTAVQVRVEVSGAG